MTHSPAELDLVRRAAAGDAAAFRQLSMTNAETLWRFARAMCGDSHQAEDLAQETLLEAWRSLARFDGRCQFSSWLYGILRHRLLKARTKRRVETTDIDPDDQALRAGSESHSPVAAAERGEDARSIEGALAGLPEVHRAVLELRFFAGASLEEIARLLECPLGTVKSRLHLGLEKLRRMEISVNLFAANRESRSDLP